MRRREFLAGIGAATAWARVAHGQPLERKLPTIGVIGAGNQENFQAFFEGLRELGYVPDQTVILETRYHGASAERAEELARELVGLQCNVIFAANPYAIDAVMRATRVIPTIGIDLEDDPVANGWAQSIPRPGGNLTGLFLGLPELGGKLIQLLKEAMPRLADVAVLWDATLGTAQLRATEAAIQASGVEPELLPVREAKDIRDAIEHAVHAHVQGLIVLTSPMILTQRALIVDLALKARLPMISGLTTFPKAGGLMAYGPDLPSMFKRAASYTDRILRGAKAGDLPIERPSKFELIINLKTAKALGLEIPWQLQQLADEVIE
jgi:putative tryptophan/tyrosine transport system substrate-binding protein